ncbi:unnamed protein product [Closterium sp. NIES-53]
MYLMTCTRPDLAYPLSILARYVAPGRHRPEHMAAAKRVLRYLCSTSGLGLVLGGRRPVVLTGHADASWADDQATQRSSQGYTFSLRSGSVSWRSTRSSSVLGSSCEAEIYAGAMAAQELRWLTYLLTDLGEQPRSPPVLYVDNKTMLALCREHRLEHRTKHIALRYFLARELQQRGQLRLAYVASQANTADIFTKALPHGDHQRFCTMLACFALLDWSCDLLFSPLCLWGDSGKGPEMYKCGPKLSDGREENGDVISIASHQTALGRREGEPWEEKGEVALKDFDDTYEKEGGKRASLSDPRSNGEGGPSKVVNRYASGRIGVHEADPCDELIKKSQHSECSEEEGTVDQIGKLSGFRGLVSCKLLAGLEELCGLFLVKRREGGLELEAADELYEMLGSAGNSFALFVREPFETEGEGQFPGVPCFGGRAWRQGGEVGFDYGSDMGPEEEGRAETPEPRSHGRVVEGEGAEGGKEMVRNVLGGPEVGGFRGPWKEWTGEADSGTDLATKVGKYGVDRVE